jgi:hypothetical protein
VVPSGHPCLFCLPHSPPGHREEPYLTEAGRDAFDRFCRLRHGELQALSGGLLQAPKPVLVEESELVKDSLNVLLGVVSATFSLCRVRRAQGCHEISLLWHGLPTHAQLEMQGQECQGRPLCGWG